jgi:hypothetical protein
MCRVLAFVDTVPIDSTAPAISSSRRVVAELVDVLSVMLTFR